MAREQKVVRFWPAAAGVAWLALLGMACQHRPLRVSPAPAEGRADAGVPAPTESAPLGNGAPPMDCASPSDSAPWVDSAPPRARAWQGPELIEDFPNLSYSAHVVMDARGNVTAAWRQYGNGDSFRVEGVGANHFDRTSGTWGQARTIDDGQHDTTTPTLAVDGAGNAMVVWEQPDSFIPPPDVHGARFDIKLSVWQPAGLVAETNSEGMLDAVVGLGSAGDGVAVWLQSKSGHSLHGVRYVGGAWQPAVELVREGSAAPGYPALMVDAKGNATMLWGESDGPRVGLHLRRMDGGSGAWGDDMTLSSQPCYAPSLAVASTGEGVVTWTQPGGPAPVLHVGYYNPARDLWMEEPLPDAGPGNPSYPSVAVNDGLAFLVWRQGVDGGDVLASRRGPDGTWLPPVRIGSSAGPYSGPQVAIDGTGAAIATWYQGPDDSARVVATRYDPSADAWGEPVILDDGAGSALSPKVALDQSGLAVVVWEQLGSNGSRHLWANRWE